MAGTCCELAFLSENPFDAQVFVGLPSSGRLQVHVNGEISEYTTGGVVSFSFVAGLNVLRLIASGGDIVMLGRLWGTEGRTQWLSLYPVGSDPFLDNTVSTGGSSVTPGESAADIGISNT
jgi:hypothetical protein